MPCGAPSRMGVLSYGGDFGEEVHDGNFVCDGLVDALSRPYAGTWPWVQAMAPDAPALAKAVESSRGHGADEARLRGLLGAPVSVVRSDEDVEAPYALDARGRRARLGTLPVSVVLSV